MIKRLFVCPFGDKAAIFTKYLQRYYPKAQNKDAYVLETPDMKIMFASEMDIVIDKFDEIYFHKDLTKKWDAVQKQSIGISMKNNLLNFNGKYFLDVDF